MWLPPWYSKAFQQGVHICNVSGVRKFSVETVECCNALKNGSFAANDYMGKKLDAFEKTMNEFYAETKGRALPFEVMNGNSCAVLPPPFSEVWPRPPPVVPDRCPEDHQLDRCRLFPQICEAAAYLCENEALQIKRVCYHDFQPHISRCDISNNGPPKICQCDWCLFCQQEYLSERKWEWCRVNKPILCPLLPIMP